MVSPTGGSAARYSRQRSYTDDEPDGDLGIESTLNQIKDQATTSTNDDDGYDPVSDPTSSINTRQSTPNYRPDKMGDSADVSQTDEQSDSDEFSWSPPGADESIDLSVGSLLGERNPDAVPAGADPEELAWTVDEALAANPLEKTTDWIGDVFPDDLLDVAGDPMKLAALAIGAMLIIAGVANQ